MIVSQVETLQAQEEGALESPLMRPAHTSRVRETEGVVCQTHIGGQALIEGVMMRGRFNWAVAVRTPEGTIYTEEHDLASGRDKNSWMYKPVIRGCTAMVESLALGFKALEIAAEHAFDLSDEEAKEKAKKEKKKAEIKETEKVIKAEAEAETKAEAKAEEAGFPKALMTISMLIGVVLGVVIFIVLPAIVTNLIVGDYGDKTLLWNVVDGILRIVIFVFYIWLIGRMTDIKRMFAYHGAEHKTIHCYEHGLELTTDNAQRFTTFHVRCGTAFLLMTMLVAIFVFTVFPITAIIDAMGVSNDVARLALIILSRIILIPLIAGLSYEVTVKWAGSRPEQPLVKLILWPGLQMQRLTTNQPDDSMIECAIAAMQRVLVREQKERATQKTGI